MKSFIITFGVAFAFGRAHAAPANRQCVELTIPVKVSMTATKWLQKRVDNNVDAIDWVVDLTTWTSPNTSSRAIGKVDVNQTLKISGLLCVPKTAGPRSSTLQLATHGVGFDKRYWDAEISPKDYSYVDAVLAEGYSILTYDRLGTGNSEKPDAYTIVQTSVQVEILRQLTLLAKSGKLVSSSKKVSASTPALDKYTPSKIIHIGHSFGSIAIAGLLSIDGTLADGAILTGFLILDPVQSARLGNGPGVAGWGFEHARSNSPAQFSDRGSGYIVPATKSNMQLTFFSKESVEDKMLEYAEQIKQPNTVAEFVSFPAVVGGLRPSGGFKGPLQFFIGERDYAFCRGDCKGISDADWIRNALYPASKAVDVYVQPGAAHGLTLSTNATAAYRVMFDFLRGAGL